MNKKQTADLVERVRKRLNQEPTIADPSKISVNIEQRGSIFNRKSVLLLEGTIQSKEEGQKAQEVTDAVLGGGDAIVIENHLVVPLV
jgi:hypothetical protein